MTTQHILGNVDHRQKVGFFINIISSELFMRAVCHDDSKFTEEEMPFFEEYTPKLRGLTYGSDEYRACLKQIKPALNHHYANNRHHPEFFENGVDGMNLIDISEMVCDWMAAVLRHDDGDVYVSLEKNKERFSLSEQIYNIIKNTIDFLLPKFKEAHNK